LAEAIEGKVARVVRAACDAGAQQQTAPPDAWDRRERLFDDPTHVVAKFTLLPAQWPGWCDDLKDFAKRMGIRWKTIGQAVGVGLLAIIPPDAQHVVPFVREIRERLKAYGGTLTVLQCDPQWKKTLDVWPDVGDALPIMRRIKEQFDPKGTLSPGRFVGGI
jgi:glycolate oxidase FAD binding subunit